MPRLVLWLGAAALAALLTAPLAAADGQPLSVTQGGTGVAGLAHPSLHYVAVPDGAGGTLLETVDSTQGGVYLWARLHGAWGIPTVGFAGQGLSGDGHTLVLGSLASPYSSPSKFLVVDLRRMRPVRTIVLDGAFSFDALSPRGSLLYLIQYTSANNLSDYIVRAYDLRTNRLLRGKIADRSEGEKAMVGSAVTRTTSAGGRWVYTLYQKPSGEGFVHALDTVRSAAYCIDLPNNKALYNIVLSLRDGGRELSARWRSGRPWLNVAVGTWRISYPRAAFPWTWVGPGIGAGLVLLSVGVLLLRRRRSEELQEHARQELGLA